jgi:hypothetical protein
MHRESDMHWLPEQKIGLGESNKLRRSSISLARGRRAEETLENMGKEIAKK